MSARFTDRSMRVHENARLAGRPAVAATSGRHARRRGLPRRGGRQLPRRRSPQHAALAGNLPVTRHGAWPRSPCPGRPAKLSSSQELIPVEFQRSWLKYDRLPDFAPRDAAHLNAVIARELEPIR